MLASPSAFRAANYVFRLSAAKTRDAAEAAFPLAQVAGVTAVSTIGENRGVDMRYPVALQASESEPAARSGP